jgi:hypothetical protein
LGPGVPGAAERAVASNELLGQFAPVLARGVRAVSSTFTFRDLDTSDGVGQSVFDLRLVAGEPRLAAHRDPDQLVLVIRFTNGAETGPCVTSRAEAERFITELAAFRASRD